LDNHNTTKKKTMLPPRSRNAPLEAAIARRRKKKGVFTEARATAAGTAVSTRAVQSSVCETILPSDMMVFELAFITEGGEKPVMADATRAATACRIKTRHDRPEDRMISVTDKRILLINLKTPTKPEMSINLLDLLAIKGSNDEVPCHSFPTASRSPASCSHDAGILCVRGGDADGERLQGHARHRAGHCEHAPRALSRRPPRVSSSPLFTPLCF
jgi:hypothetical protein